MGESHGVRQVKDQGSRPPTHVLRTRGGNWPFDSFIASIAELDTQIAVLNRRSCYRGAALMTLAALSLVGLGELMLHAPSCTEGANIPTILIGGAIGLPRSSGPVGMLV